MVVKRGTVLEHGYEEIAEEYYFGFHPTSRNFDQTSAHHFQKHQPPLPQEGLVLELGAGIGRSAEYCKVSASRIVQTDASMRMLELVPREASLLRVRCNALDLPFPADTVSLITAFLYDPFNVPSLYVEVARVLRPGGYFVGTLPHHTWGEALRRKLQLAPDRTVFRTKSGEEFTSPSYLVSEEWLRDVLSRHRLDIERLDDVMLPTHVSEVSPHVAIAAQALGLSEFEIPLVQVLIARRSA